MAYLRLHKRQLTVVLMDDAAIRRYNREHRGVDEATDVLAYPTAEPDDVAVPAVPHLGDIFISVETAARQAAEHGHDLASEVKVLAAHGLTHLLGYDHPTEEAWRVFHHHQQLILNP
jgi:probable rRNA maturation factor